MAKLTYESFVKRVNEKIGDKYNLPSKDWWNSNYKNQKTKITLVCPEHGEFVKSVQQLIKGNSCDECKNRTAKKEKPKETMKPDEEIVYNVSKISKLVAEFIFNNNKKVKYDGSSFDLSLCLKENNIVTALALLTFVDNKIECKVYDMSSTDKNVLIGHVNKKYKNVEIIEKGK